VAGHSLSDTICATSVANANGTDMDALKQRSDGMLGESVFDVSRMQLQTMLDDVRERQQLQARVELLEVANSNLRRAVQWLGQLVQKVMHNVEDLNNRENEWMPLEQPFGTASVDSEVNMATTPREPNT